MATNKDWEQSAEGINTHYDMILEENERLYQSGKLSYEDIEEKRNNIKLCREYKLSQLDHNKRMTEIGSGTSIADSNDSKSNKKPEKEINDLPSSVTKEEFDKLNDKEKLKYIPKTPALSNTGVDEVISCFNKLTPVLSAVAPLQSALAPADSIIQQFNNIKPLISTASLATSLLDSAKSAASGFSGVLSPVTSPITSIVDAITGLVTSMVTIGYVFYTQAPKIYKEIVDGLKEFKEKKEELQKQLEEAKKIKEAYQKVLDEEKKNIELAEEEAKRDQSKTYVKISSTATARVVISEEDYNSLPDSEKQKYREELINEKIDRYVKKVELPAELKSAISQATDTVDSVSDLFDKVSQTADMYDTYMKSIDMSQLINDALSSIGINIPTFEDIMASAKKDAESKDMSNIVSSITKQFGSIKQEYNLKR